MLFRFSLYGFLKNQRYFEPFLMLAFLDKGLSFFVIGLLIACRDLTVNFLEIPSGAIADACGRRKSMMISFVAYIVSFSILGSVDNLPLLFVGMIAYGVGDTFRTGTHKAMIFEWLRLQNRQDERTQIYGYTRSWSQIGSAVSSIIAALFIIFSNSYQYVFYAAILPYVLNLINFAGYPAELDGEPKSADSVRESLFGLKTTRNAVADKTLRRLILESMGWEGFFGAVKDYLQPVLQTLALGMVASVILSAIGLDFRSKTQVTAFVVGITFAVLSLISAYASRRAHRFVGMFETEDRAAKWLWPCNLIVMLVVLAAAWFRIAWLLAIGFVAMHILKNLWRPILISRFDSAGKAQEGATLMSIESQAQRLSTMIFAPLIGWVIDVVSTTDDALSLWPIGLIGSLICLCAIAASRKMNGSHEM